LPACRVANPYGCGDGFRFIYNISADDRSSAFSLEAHHLGFSLRPSCLIVFGKAFPVSGDVAGIAHRYKQIVRGIVQLIDNLEGGCLLPLYAVGIKRIDPWMIA